jgi:chloramphenicol-sensitive protein RarD
VISVDALPGLATETLLLVPFALAWLIVCERTGSGAFGHSPGPVNLLLIGSGLATAIPLFLFAYGARALPYSTVGVLQYIGPTLQLLCGVLLLHEPFTPERAIGFALIWAALVIYAADGLWSARSARLARA